MHDVVNQIATKHAAAAGGLLPCLHELQERFGFIPAESHAQLADLFSLSAAEVHGVISFYHDFRDRPASNRAVQICCAEACQAVGSRDLESQAPQVLGVEFGETHSSGVFRLERVYCLGNCACGPSVRVGDVVHGRVSVADLPGLVEPQPFETDPDEAGSFETVSCEKRAEV